MLKSIKLFQRTIWDHELSFVMARNGTSSVGMLDTACTKLTEILYLVSKVTRTE